MGARGADESVCRTTHRVVQEVEMEAKVRVMVVDDEAIVCKRLKPALEKDGHEVEVFDNGRDAIRRMDEQGFDIVVTDVRMEHVDGLQILERVMAVCPRTKVILITGYATVELAREALVKGAFDFIAKPFKPADLRAIVDRAIAEAKRAPAAGG
jgi:DNA-binding NtrC family response regulator